MNDERKELEQQVFKWIEIAEEDLTMAKHAFTIESNIPYRLIGYHAQQCAEKYLKALLVSINLLTSLIHIVSKSL